MNLALPVLVPALPALGAAATLAVGRRSPGLARPLAIVPVAVSAVLALVVAIQLGTGQVLDAATRLTPTGGPEISLAIHLDGYSSLISVLVGLVATCVQVYSTAYLKDDPRYPSYAALVSLFTAAMFLVVYSGDLIVLLVGWEVMGICSYFLIGHHWETEDARSASLKAFLVTKLGDVPFLFGIFLLGADAGSFRIEDVLRAAGDGQLGHPTLIALLLLAGVAGKSAQFPLHTWLPDAMAGPTPVSALIHAATMVAAGIYLVARLLPVFLLSGAALVVLAVMAAVTMIGSALCALAQDDLKRVLAYSTVGQLGYMAGALASGDREASVFHLVSHGAFKALLFLAAGVVIHAAHTNSISAMSRIPGLRKRVPDAYWTMAIALVALIGLPPFSGFFSKEAVLTAAEHAANGEALTNGLGPASAVPQAAGWIVLISAGLTALLTAAYAARLFLVAFHSPAGAAVPAAAAAPGLSAAADHEPDAPYSPEPDEADPAVAEPPAMRWPLWVLAVPTMGFGIAGLRSDWLPALLDGGSLKPSAVTAVTGTGLAVVGVLLAYGAWRSATARVTDGLPAPAEHGRVPEQAGAPAAEVIVADPGRALLGPLFGPARHGFGVDRLYSALFVRPVEAAARLVRFLDREVVETYVRGSGAGADLLGRVVRLAQTGNAQTYLSALLAGVVLLAVLVAV
ncbi:NADH-quinone oxidoreductase subunit 5 family protein [Kitasatospora purpeofusca]|uniref:NADH-quinone oxidoreductase subunit 5 family protein n=1 Tax=Kitasatospora purpeofusca TaxID=67352 RepID=UPI00224F9B27|nr:NADH-quinone oxidoreductase subunit L [Kitasatospora purpeofusca]MCX4753416.1 NADH-quinone oxidoreductase subunit L [Kitasatospora purpeofusca]WSR32918.1 NADH-quinone oxidoreductase subunit L [Kitasatospora purpeofusca]WSR41012.1 NADH-quinone oxidoreductase subunit L [Kitasatospora purpeofusca]